jgi:hypothetical protein
MLGELGDGEVGIARHEQAREDQTLNVTANQW